MQAENLIEKKINQIETLTVDLQVFYTLFII